MPAKRLHKPPVRSPWIHSSRLHVVLYSMLLVATPFILLQNFLVETIGAISRSTFQLGGVEVPIVPAAALILATVLLVRFRAQLTTLRIVAGLVALAMIALAQQITDYYFDHNFYDLQQNWHYVAYGVFAFMLYRDLTPRGTPLARIMLVTYVSALAFSSFDEAFQMRMSNRVFDLSDTAKDVWGALMGMAVVFLGGPRAGALLADWRTVRQPRLRGYLRHPFSLLILMGVLTLLFLCFSSLLTDFEHWPLVIIFTLGAFAVFFALFHVSQYKWAKYALVSIVTAVILVQAYFFVKYRSDHVVYNCYGLTVYKGIPIPFFDVMICPDGTFRLVDKKHYFNSRDQAFFLKQKPDILLIGSGADGRGGKGFHLQAVNQFVYNRYTQGATQVIILRTPEACRLFNRLKREHRNVLFILHNTC